MRRLFLFVMFYTLCQPVFAAPTSIFDPDLDYSICYRLTENNFAMLESRIVGVSEVANKSVLIIDRKNFSGRNDRGFIVMDSVIIILPADQAKNQGNSFCSSK